jgi:ParB family chromosome partitioning protein
MALGRGLGAILEEVSLAYEQDINDTQHLGSNNHNGVVEEIDIDSIAVNPYQPRKHFDNNSLVELSHSIQTHGLLQPIVVIAKENGYLLVAGERRLRAHKIAKIFKIKAIIADIDIDAIRLRELALIENIQRENLNAIELANSYSELIEVHNITHNELSNIVHKSRSQITNTMRLLTLSRYTQERLIEGAISQGHAKVLVGLSDERQKRVVDTIIGQKLTVRETENLIKELKEDKKHKKKSTPKSSWIKSYSDKIAEYLPFSHRLKDNKIEIAFDNEDELIRFIEIIKKT